LLNGLKVCPSTELTTQFHPVSDCELPSYFVPQDVVIPGWLATATGGYLQDTMVLRPIQLHALAFAAFASSVAPFGGFLASAIKRTVLVFGQILALEDAIGYHACF
jgi:phosphatidate cytidylyltransferase